MHPDNSENSSPDKKQNEPLSNLERTVHNITHIIRNDLIDQQKKGWERIESAFSSLLANQDAFFVNQLMSQQARFNDFIKNAGYKVIGDYYYGPLTITEYNQLIRYKDHFYKLNAATDLPFTTAGTTDASWNATDSRHLVSVGDGVNRPPLGDSEDKIVVTSYAELQSTVPTYAGQVIILTSYYTGETISTGGGVFVATAGCETDDGGHICVPTGSSGIYWLRWTYEVKLSDYGVKTFPWDASYVTTENDQSDKVNAALQRAIVTGYPIIAPPASRDNALRGIPVLKTIDITHVRDIRGDMLLFAHNLRGSYTEDPGLTNDTGVSQPFVLMNKNADFDDNGGYVFSSVKGPRKYEIIRVINFGDTSTRLNGQLHFFGDSTFEGVYAEGFQGWGIRWGIVQDSLIGHQSVSGCGNINQFALYAYGYPAAANSGSDFCNNVTFQSIICEYSQDRSVFISGPAVHIARIHEEGTIVSGNKPDDWGQYSIDNYATDYGSGIANFGLAPNYGSCSQINIIDLSNSSQASLNAVLNMSYGDIGLIQATRTSSDKTYLSNVIVATGWSGDGGSIETIQADQVYVSSTATLIGDVCCTLLEVNGATATIEKVVATYMNLYTGTVKAFSGPASGYANIGGSSYPARLVDSTILNCPLYLDTTSGADVVIDNCHIASAITHGRFDGTEVTKDGTRPCRFTNCTFPSAFDFASGGTLLEFSNCTFDNLVIGSETYYQIHKGSRINKLTKEEGSWGLWAFDDQTIIKSMSGDWAWPDTAYDNYNLRAYDPLTGRSKKYTTYGWVNHDGPYLTTTASFSGIAAKGTASKVVTVADVVVSDSIIASYEGNTNGLMVWGQVTQNGSVTLYVFNPTDSSRDLSGTFKIKVA